MLKNLIAVWLMMACAMALIGHYQYNSPQKDGEYKKRKKNYSNRVAMFFAGVFSVIFMVLSAMSCIDATINYLLTITNGGWAVIFGLLSPMFVGFGCYFLLMVVFRFGRTLLPN